MSRSRQGGRSLVEERAAAAEAAARASNASDGSRPVVRIWGRRNSANVQKVLWCCAELGLAFVRIDAGGPYGVTSEPEYLQMNPMGLIPTIEDEGFVLWESHAILRYLSAKYGLGGLCPEDLRARADADHWMDWVLGALFPALVPAFVNLVRTAEENRDGAAVRASAEAVGGLMRILDTHLLRRRFLCGDTLTMADIPAGVATHRWLALAIERPHLPRVAAWYARLGERPAFREHVALPLS